MNKLLIHKTHVLCSFSSSERGFLSVCNMPAYWIYFSYVRISWLKRYSVTGPKIHEIHDYVWSCLL